MSFLDEIRARAVKQPCTNYMDHACSRGDRVKLLAALDAALALHKQYTWEGRLDEGICEHDDEAYPCSTVRGINEALEGGAA